MSKSPAKFLLKNDPQFAETPDYGELRRRGLEHISALSGDLWTDHNAHDPGITLLELLCYALTDLGYRSQLKPAELFAPATNDGADGNFFTPAEILTNNPVTLLDYRKMLVDIPGVRNAWLEPADQQEVALYYKRPQTEDCSPRNLRTAPAGKGDFTELRLNGLYRVLLDLDPLLTTVTEDCRANTSTIGSVLAEVERRLGAHRNLCEDFLDTEILKDEEIGLCLDLDLTPKADPTTVLGAVFAAIEDFISPRVRFFSLQELLQDGKAMEEIFRGRPYLPAYNTVYGTNARSHGFVDTEQLAELTRPKVIQASDLYRVIMKVEGVRAIRELKMASFIDGLAQGPDEAWELRLTPGHRPIFTPEEGGYTFHKGQLLVPLDTSAIIARFRRRLADYRKTAYSQDALDVRPPYGRHRKDLGNYFSVQHELPVTYGLGKGDLSASASAERRTQARQLGGFLTFFDQLLANYCSQLARTREVYSWLPGVNKTSFTNAQIGIPHETEILRFKAMVSELQHAAPAIVRNQEFFDHPLNRDQAIATLVNNFRDLPLEELRGRLMTVEQEDDRYHFQFRDARGGSLVRGLKDYATPELAREAGEAAALKLLFQGGVADNYRKDNYPEAHRYGFTIQDRPVDHASFLEEIAESPGAFAERRNEVLDHLLGRFNESFTDYVLLTYALEQATPEPGQLIAAKERFLAQYPRISRERGKGFDYRHQELKNKRSGLEQRIGHLIGLDETDAPLNAFSVRLEQQQQRLVWRDHRGRVLLRSVRSFGAEENKESFAVELLDLLADPAAYRREDCLHESIYTYVIVNPKGEVVAEAAATFPSQERREEHLNCTLAYFGSELAWTEAERKELKKETEDLIGEVGLRIVLDAEEQGHYVYFPSPDGKKTYLETLAIHADEKAARQAGLELLELARDPSAYRPWQLAGRFGFELIDAAGTIVGRHPKDYGTSRTRDKHLRTVQNFFTERVLAHALRQHSDRFFWNLASDDHDLVGVIPFGDADTALASWALNATPFGTIRNYSVTERSGGEWWVEVRRDDDLLLAQSGPFLEKPAAHAALVALADYWGQENILPPKIDCRAGAWYFELWHNDALVLRGSREYPDRIAAAWACLLAGKLAADEENYRWTNDPDGCLRGFRLLDEAENRVAETITFYKEEAAAELRKDFLACATANYLPCGEDFRAFRWHYRLLWENCHGRCETLLRSVGPGWNSAAETKLAARELLDWLAGEAPFVDGMAGEQFTFAAGEENKVLAVHPAQYPTAAERDRVRDDALDYFRAYQQLNTPETSGWTTEDTLYVHCKSPASCAEEFPEVPAGADCVLSAYQLQKDTPLAFHPEALKSAGEREELVKNIRDAANTGHFAYAAFSVARAQVQRKGQGARFYYEWEVPGLPAFRSVRGFADGAAAETGFWEDLPGLLRAGERAKTYQSFKLSTELQQRQRDCWPEQAPAYAEYRLEDLGTEEQLALVGPHGLPLVYLPGVLAADMPAARTGWRDYCRCHPFRPEASGWRVYVYDPARPVVWLEGSSLYPDHASARRGYLELLELLSTAANYRADDEPEAGRYGLQIVETLLEAKTVYADTAEEINKSGEAPVLCPAVYPRTTYQTGDHVFPVATDCPTTGTNTAFCPRAWEEGLETFLLYGTETKNCYDFLDARAACRHGFRIVRDGYRVARNPRENHTPAEREALLDWLFHDAGCSPKNTSAPYETCLSYGAGNYRVLLQTTDAETLHWRIVRPFQVMTTAKDEDHAGEAEHQAARKRATTDWNHRRTELLNLAQEPDFYQARFVETDAAGVARYRLLLLEETGTVVMESPRLYSREEIVAAARERIIRARRYPIYLFRGKYGFQVFSQGMVPTFQSAASRLCLPTFSAPASAPKDVLPETTLYGGTLELNLQIPGEVIWESAEEFSTEAGARCAYDCFCVLVKDPRNYQRRQLADCNLFGLELTRPDRVLAEHPRRYAGTSELSAAKERTFACINREGMRLVEHLLLRPRTPGDATIPNICPLPLTTADTADPFCPNRAQWATNEKQLVAVPGVKPLEQDLLSAPLPLPYVAGADPYSYWATVVLPYWPRRFQNANFRAFFEDSLRREAPAHVALKICWLDPKQFGDFERLYHRWLNTLGRRENCSRTGAQKGLIEFLATMTSVYPPSRLQAGCTPAGPTEAGAVLLGKTQLS